MVSIDVCSPWSCSVLRSRWSDLTVPLPEWLELKQTCLISSLHHIWYSHDIFPHSAVHDTSSFGLSSLEYDNIWIIWNNILCQARISEFLFKWESSLLNDKYKYLYSTPMLCYSVWIYNSKPVKRKIYTKKWRNILTLWFGTGHCAFHYGFIPLSSTLYFLSYLCLLSLQKLYDTDVFHQRYWQVHLLFNYSKLKHLILLHPDDSSLNLWGVV